MTHIGCWAHARRKFHEARYNAPAPACHALGLIRQLYEIEASIKDASHDQRHQARQALAYLHDLIRRPPAAPIGQLEQFLPGRWSASPQSESSPDCGTLTLN